MNIETRDFGNIEISEEELINFVEPIFGFEENRKYTVLINDEINNDILWLQSTTNKDVCFLLIDPFTIFADYNPTIPNHFINTMGLTDENTVIRTMLVITDTISNATTNLKSPIIINKETHIAAQIIVDDDYKIKTPLFAQKEEE